nr:reverse transcriptase domain-containing protein [Tanacetum cinerariifolium]
MSSPNHPTSNIEDAFSSNFLDYIPASPDYFPASPRNTSSDSSNNSSGLVLIASPTLSHFHNDPYMKVMHASSAIIPPQVLIPPPAIMPPSPMLSPIFSSQEFFVPEELLPPKEQVSNLTFSSTDLSNPSQKQACILVPPSFLVYTPTPPQIFEIGKSSIKMHLKHHEKQIEDILNYLEELSFHPIKKIEESLVNEAYASWVWGTVSHGVLREWYGTVPVDAGAQDRSVGRMGVHEFFGEKRMAPKRTSTSAAPTMNQAAVRQLVADSVAAALEAQAANMANADNTNRNPEPREVPVKMEDEFYHLTMKGNNLKTYAKRFQELTVLCPNMIPNTEKLMDVFIWGLPKSIEGNVTASKPQTLEEAINIT